MSGGGPPVTRRRRRRRMIRHRLRHPRRLRRPLRPRRPRRLPRPRRPRTLGLEVLGGRGGHHIDDEHLGIRHQRDTVGKRDGRRGELCADLGALDGHGELIRDRLHVGFDLDRVGVLGDECAVGGFTLDDDVDLDGHLLAAAHHEQVGVLDVAPDRVDLERLRQRQLLLALDVQGEHGVGARVPQHGGEITAGQQQVLRIGAVAVEHGGDLALAPGAT
jgi:hypothetical protein